MHIFFAFNVLHTSRYFGLIVTRELFLVLSPPSVAFTVQRFMSKKQKKEAKQETLKRRAESKNKKEKNAFDNATKASFIQNAGRTESK